MFDKLNKAHYKKQRNAPSEEQLRQQQEEQIMTMEYFNDLLAKNSTRHVNIKAIKVVGGGNTRSSFLKDQLDPILAASGQDLKTVVRTIDETHRGLASFGIYDRISFSLDEAQRNFFSSPFNSDVDVTATLHLKSAKRFIAKTGTDLGNGEGNGYANFMIKSLFGGAEMLSFDATIGTRTRSSYLLNFSAPLNNSSRFKGEALAYVSSRKIPWASHEQIIRGLSAKVKSSEFEAGYEAVLRTISAVAPNASDTVRLMAGDSVKTSIFWNFHRDTRNNHLLASNGYYFKFGQEMAGLLGPERGDLPFVKGTFEAQVAKGFNYNPAIAAESKTELSPVRRYISEQRQQLDSIDDVVFHYTMKTGMLWAHGRKTHFMDRFFLGGPNDVRGFYLNGLGPRDGNDSVGGEIYFAHGLSMFTRIPKLTAPDSFFRALFFVNGGSLLHLNQDDVRGTVHEMLSKPSVSAGFGVVYRHPAARFELNFTMPLIARELEGTRKGLQFGIGLSFL